MRWSWRLITVAGIGVYMHVTFLLLLAWAGWSSYLLRHNWADAWGGIAFIVALFVIVVLHELGHALTAKRFGIRTLDITLLPIGGVARLERMPDDPKQELAVALAGPAVNLLLAVLFFVALGLTGKVATLDLFMQAGFVANLMAINLWMAAFNLLPAFPMDGGRVLRALLATRMNYVRATRIAATVGQGMAFLFGLVGLFVSNPFLILIALFVWIGAGQEAGMVQMKSALNGVPVSDIMITDFRTLTPEEPLSRAVEYLLAGYQQDFPVMRDGKLLGLLTRSALLNGLAHLGQNMPVADIMQKEFTTADPSEMAETAFARLQRGDCRSMPVLRDGQLVGIVTSENVGEFLMVQAALQNEARTARLAKRYAT